MTDAPMRIHFISFAEIEREGVPGDADVLFGYGPPNSSWSGGRFWRSERLVKAIETFVRRGGGLVALQAWSHTDEPEPRWAMADILGVTGEGTQRFEIARVDESLAADVGDIEAKAAVRSDAMVKTTPGRKHWISSGLPDIMSGVQEAARVCDLGEDGETIFALKSPKGDVSPGLVVRSVGNGRVIYVAGWSSDFAFTRMIRRALYWAAQRERAADALSIDGADSLFIYAYPDAHVLALFSAEREGKRVAVRCAPGIFGLRPDATVRLIDVVASAIVFEGTGEAMSRGFHVELVPSCVRLLAVRGGR